MASDLPPAVVVGLGSIVGLQTARLLHARGVPVIGMAGDPHHFAARTRACRRLVTADIAGEGLVPALVQLGSELGRRAVLVPCTDHAVLQASARRDELTPFYDLVLPPHDVVRELSEKAQFGPLAERLGLPVPRTRVLTTPAEAEAAGASLRFPVVLKPTVKTARWKAATGLKALRVEDAAELIAAHARLAPHTPALVAQEYVGGGDDQLFTCNAYLDRDGTPLVTFTTRKRRQWPPHLGIASFAEECEAPDVAALTLQLFAATGFRGMGYLEVKREPTTGTLLLIEANVGRPTGRSATAEAGGVELLHTAYCDAAGLPLPHERQQQHTGAAWWDLRRDVLSALHHIRRGELTPLGWVRSLLAPHGRTAHAVLSWRDPLPFLLETTQSLRKVVRRAVAGQRR